MKRLLYQNLLDWKNKENRKPLILNGARQVGKTWLVKEFGKNEYKNLVYIKKLEKQNLILHPVVLVEMVIGLIFPKKDNKR